MLRHQSTPRKVFPVPAGPPRPAQDHLPLSHRWLGSQGMPDVAVGLDPCGNPDLVVDNSSRGKAVQVNSTDTDLRPVEGELIG